MRIIAAALVLVAVLGVTACATDPLPVTVQSSPFATLQAPARGLDEIVGTTWLGIDSDGDEIQITFDASHEPTVTTNGVDYVSGVNTWSVEGDMLTVVHLGIGADGTYTYTGIFDTSDGTIALSYTAEAGAEGDLTLAQVL